MTTEISPSVDGGGTLGQKDGTVLQRWDDVVAAAPRRVAFSSPGRSVSYLEADRRAQVLADVVVSRIPADRRPVGLLVTHDADGLVALLAALKTKRLVVPLDPHLPVERLQQIVTRAGFAACIVDGAHVRAAGRLEGTGVLVEVDDTGSPVADDQVGSGGAVDTAATPAGLLANEFDPPVDGLAMVFTSGSTGVPKGVVLTNALLLHAADAAHQTFGIGTEDTVGLVLPVSFAAGLIVLASFGMAIGAGVWAFDPRELGVRALIEGVEADRPTTLHCTPHLLRNIVAEAGPDQVLSSLRLVTTAGEPVHGRDVESARRHLSPDAEFFNWVGSSEAGSVSTFRVAPGEPAPSGILPAGQVAPGRDVHVLRPDGSRADLDEAGEVVIVSDAVSAGYWRDPAMTAQRFGVADDGRRCYRTGDLGRLGADGVLQLLGRADDAIKVRGYLVEPAEVAAAILANPAVAEAVVLSMTGLPPAPSRLVAYVAPDPRFPTESISATRRRLRAALPEYMVPTTIVQLASLPHNERGKVDRAALPPAPEPVRSRPVSTRDEISVAQLWAFVLGVDEVGADDDFMLLGADSLAVEEMLALAEDRFGVELVTSELVMAPTVAEFARRVRSDANSREAIPTLVPLRRSGSRTPLFCFAGAGALGMSFLAVARRLEDRPVLAFQAHAFERRGIPDWSVVRAARRHLRVLRSIQPHGPYLLAGHSFGGLLALEVAQRLRAEGEEVSLVALLDTYLPLTMRETPAAATPSRAGVHALGHLLGVALASPLRRLLPEGLPPWRQLPERLRIPLAGVVRFGMSQQSQVFFNHAQVVARRHRLAPYGGRVLAVFVEGNPDGPSAWDPVLRGPTEVRSFACDHNSLLRAPFAVQVAELLDEQIRLVEGPSTDSDREADLTAARGGHVLEG